MRDASGRAWLVENVAGGAGTALEGYDAAVAGLAAAVTLAGGLLAPGAVQALVSDRAGREHVAACGKRAWLVLLPQPVRGDPPPVRFLDAAGELVAVPLADDVRLEPVHDAREPCPVCRAVNWGRVIAAPAGRYGSDGAGRPTAAVCRRCGHTEHLGVLFAAATDDAQLDDETVTAIEAQTAREFAAAARTAAFALYGLRHHEPVVRGYGRHRGTVDSVTLAFTTLAGRVTVTTDASAQFEPPAWVARHALEHLLHERDGAWPTGSDTAVALWLRGRERALAATAAEATDCEAILLIDDAPTRFVCVADGEQFAAVARIARATVTITGPGAPNDLALETVRAADL